jgi:N-glycosylase/DNA lyase
MQNKKLKELRKIYFFCRESICKRLEEFEQRGKRQDKNELFIELAFCIFTPQSSAHQCWQAVLRLVSKNLLFSAPATRIAKELRGVRFHNNKSKYLVRAREVFPEFMGLLAQKAPAFDIRDWLVEKMRGLGYKEASHFLRNIGFGSELAILDRHIMRCLVEFGVILEIPVSLNKKKYLEIERKMKDFSEKINISLSHLDLVFWYREKGEIFK